MASLIDDILETQFDPPLEGTFVSATLTSITLQGKCIASPGMHYVMGGPNEEIYKRIISAVQYSTPTDTYYTISWDEPLPSVPDGTWSVYGTTL